MNFFSLKIISGQFGQTMGKVLLKFACMADWLAGRPLRHLAFIALVSIYTTATTLCYARMINTKLDVCTRYTKMELENIGSIISYYRYRQKASQS